MTKEQKEVQQAHLDEEKKVIRQLKQVYSRAAKDCEEKIAALNARTDMQNLQSIVYQKQYQQALKSQIDGILNTLQSNEFNSISEYLTASYTNGFVGAMYDLTAQGIPVISPIKQQNVVKAVQTDSKISTTLYTKLGEDVSYLKKSIKAELSRGTANGSTWTEIASHIANGMNSPLKTAMNRAILIARTEGHRIQQESQLDALHDAQDNGADVVKQWDATLDSRTRSDHRAADGQIRELDDKFRVGGESMTAPGVGGSARNVCNCRCCLLQRARWALDEDELKTLKTRAEYFGLDKSKDFTDFKQKYLNLPAKAATMKITISDEAQKLVEYAEKNDVAYREVSMHDKPLSETEIIEVLSGGDKTKGSCASVALCYVGQKGGMDVLDFRDGDSRSFFGQWGTLKEIGNLPGLTTIKAAAKSSITAGNKLLKQVEAGKEYYFVAGKHASIVRKTDEETLQYLELQSATNSGWTNFDGNPRYTLAHRFGCSSSSKWSKYGLDEEAMMIEVDSFKDSPDLKKLLGYINTASDNQKKGGSGYAK